MRGDSEADAVAIYAFAIRFCDDGQGTWPESFGDAVEAGVRQNPSLDGGGDVRR